MRTLWRADSPLLPATINGELAELPNFWYQQAANPIQPLTALKSPGTISAQSTGEQRPLLDMVMSTPP